MKIKFECEYDIRRQCWIAIAHTLIDDRQTYTLGHATSELGALRLQSELEYRLRCYVLGDIVGQMLFSFMEN